MQEIRKKKFLICILVLHAYHHFIPEGWGTVHRSAGSSGLCGIEVVSRKSDRQNYLEIDLSEVKTLV